MADDHEEGTTAELANMSLEESDAHVNPAKNKRKKKKKGSKQGSDTASSDSGTSVGAVEIPEAEKDAVLKRVNETLMKAESGELELIALDSLYLKTKQLNNLIKRLQKPNASNAVMTISLANNNLTDDACKSLQDALREPSFCPSLLSINVRSNPRITQIGHQCLEDITKLRKDVQVFYGADLEAGNPDDDAMEAFKLGAVINEEEQAHARPPEQWAELAASLRGPAPVSRISQVMREICDAVCREITKEEAIDPAEVQVQGGVVATKQVKLPPGEYCHYAVQQLPSLQRVFDIVPAAMRTTTSRKPVAGVGSHRFHASSLVCHLVRCACDPEHKGGRALLQGIVDVDLVPLIAHLTFSYPTCSCLHAIFLDAFSIHTLPSMPAALWRPLLQANLSAPPGASGGKQLAALPDLLFQHASTALNSSIGLRSGLIGMVIQLGRDLQLACEENRELKAALEEHKAWLDLSREGGPLAQLVEQQQGSLAGGKPNGAQLQGMYEDDNHFSQEPQRALFGIREYAQMHQSLNLGVPLQ